MGAGSGLVQWGGVGVWSCLVGMGGEGWWWWDSRGDGGGHLKGRMNSEKWKRRQRQLHITNGENWKCDRRNM